jgi:hypothetical protein
MELKTAEALAKSLEVAVLLCGPEVPGEAGRVSSVRMHAAAALTAAQMYVAGLLQNVGTGSGKGGSCKETGSDLALNSALGAAGAAAGASAKTSVMGTPLSAHPVLPGLLSPMEAQQYLNQLEAVSSMQAAAGVSHQVQQGHEQHMRSQQKGQLLLQRFQQQQQQLQQQLHQQLHQQQQQQLQQQHQQQVQLNEVDRKRPGSRRKSACPFCAEISKPNCGLVSGKCPNRLCGDCGARHRLHRCPHQKRGESGRGSPGASSRGSPGASSPTAGDKAAQGTGSGDDGALKEDDVDVDGETGSDQEEDEGGSKRGHDTFSAPDPSARLPFGKRANVGGSNSK